AEPAFDAFTKETGIRVDAKWDTEAAKTTGLVQTLIAERDHPRADLFWSGEAAQMAVLARDGLLAKALAREGGAQDDDPDGRYACFAARARVLVVHDKAVAAGERPRSIEDLAKPRWKGRAGIANPLFGTTATHVAALVAAWGEERTRAFLRSLKANEVAVCAG